MKVPRVNCEREKIMLLRADFVGLLHCLCPSNITVSCSLATVKWIIDLEVLIRWISVAWGHEPASPIVTWRAVSPLVIE